MNFDDFWKPMSRMLVRHKRKKQVAKRWAKVG